MREIKFCPYCCSPLHQEPIKGQDNKYCPHCQFRTSELTKSRISKLYGIALIKVGPGMVFVDSACGWNLPGGIIEKEPSESIVTIARRTTGLEVNVHNVIDITGGHPFVLSYFARPIGGMLNSHTKVFGQNELPDTQYNDLIKNCIFKNFDDNIPF